MGPRPDLSQLSDQEVVALALEREEGGWVELVNRHKERVSWIIGRQVATPEHVEQLAQDTFFKAAMFLQSYHPENSFVTWITTIAYRTAIDYVRRRPPDSVSLPHRVSLDLVDIEAPNFLDWPTPDPGTPELRAAVDNALDRLRATHRKCFEMHVLEQRSYDEIAKELRMPVGTVKSHVNRAFKKLRALLRPVLDSSDPEKTGLLEDDGAAGEPAP
jgi:RNA polymerase sigma-70 factor (ECF subfamily)